MKSGYRPLSQVAGDNLKCLIRKSTKYHSQDDFAFDFGVEIRTLSRWLNQGIKNIDTIKELADFLSVDILELLQDK